MTSKVISFGEILLRLAPPNQQRFSQANQYQATFGGGEANVAVALANFGHHASFVSKLPDNPLGNAAISTLRKHKVGTDLIARGGQRIGIYFLEHGASIRPSKVTYDRKYSAMSESQPDEFNWGEIFKDVDWFHTTGITPALSPLTAQTTLDAVKTAKNLGIQVSCDLNYRNQLWTREEARDVMSEIVQYTDVIIANEEDCSDIFGIRRAATNVHKGKLEIDHYKQVASEVMALSKAKLVAITLRESISASDNNWAAMLFDGQDYYVSSKYALHIIDRVGGGDSFAGGLIHGLLQKLPLQETLEFAVAASALKHTIHGDFNLVSEAEVMEIVNGNTSGRVQR